MASSSIYFLKDRILIHPNQRTTAGVEIASSPYINLGLDADATELGKAIVDAISNSHGTVAHPTDWKGLAVSRLKAAGVKTEKAFMAKAVLIQVRTDSTGYLIEPMFNAGLTGSEKGFLPYGELKISLPLDTSITELGERVINSKP